MQEVYLLSTLPCLYICINLRVIIIIIVLILFHCDRDFDNSNAM